MSNTTLNPPHVSAQLNSKTDGSPITTGVAAYVVTDNNAQATGGGTLSHKTDGLWTYTPTELEASATSLVVSFVHSDAITQHRQIYPDKLLDVGVWEFELTANPGASATTLDTSLAGNHHDGAFTDAWIVFTTGPAAGGRAYVTGYTDSSGRLTLQSALTGTPVSGDTGLVLHRN